MTTPEIIDQIHELILEDRRISAKSIAEWLCISSEWVGFIIHDDFDIRKLSAKWVPKCLNPDQIVNGASRLSNFWNFFGAIQMISCCDWWPWTKPGYITMPRRQSNNQRSDGIAYQHPLVWTGFMACRAKSVSEYNSARKRSACKLYIYINRGRFYSFLAIIYSVIWTSITTCNTYIILKSNISRATF